MTSELTPLGDALIKCLLDINAAIVEVKAGLARVLENIAELFGEEEDPDYEEEVDPLSETSETEEE